MENKWEHIFGEWQKFSVEVKKKWAQLTDEELAQINGSRNSLASVIQRRYFITKKAAHEEIDGWLDKLKV